MVGFYAIRRLIESDKTSVRVPRRRVPVRVLPNTGTEPHKLDRWSPWEQDDYDARSRGELDAHSLVQEFFHSFILMLSFDESERLTGAYVASDRTKKSPVHAHRALPAPPVTRRPTVDYRVRAGRRVTGASVSVACAECVRRVVGIAVTTASARAPSRGAQSSHRRMYASPRPVSRLTRGTALPTTFANQTADSLPTTTGSDLFHFRADICL